MLGFLFGVGLTVFVLNRVRRGGFRRHGGPRRARARRREWVLDRLSARLDTTPAQDRVLEEVVDDLMDVFAEERGSFTSARSALADVLAGATFDGAAWDAMRADQEASFGKVHGAARRAMEKLFDVLDEEQRASLAEMVGRGHRGAHCHRGHRHLHAA